MVALDCFTPVLASSSANECAEEVGVEAALALASPVAKVAVFAIFGVPEPTVAVFTSTQLPVA